MPEGPEVAVMSQIVDKFYANKTLISVEIVSGRYSKKQRPNNMDKFIKALPLKLVKVNSQGKFMWFEFIKAGDTSKKWYLWSTLGMTGIWSRTEDIDFIRAKLTFRGKIFLFFADMRNFGTLKFVNNPVELGKKLKSLGPDFLKDAHFTLKSVKKYDTPIVRLLTDQKKLGSGIGNYLSSEVLYRAKIDPSKLGSELTNTEISRLTRSIKYTIKLAYTNNNIGYMKKLGPDVKKITKRKYHPTINLGKATFHPQVYRQKEDKYGNPVSTIKIQNDRTIYWVPAIQK